MINIPENMIYGHSTAESRWARLGPYYAMFPLEFAFETVREYSNRGDYIIDPFAGRFSSIFAGSIIGRKGLGIEINPVGWLYGKAKTSPASLQAVLKSLETVYKKRHYYKRTIRKMAEFFRMCFCDEVLQFLFSARKNLNWLSSEADATLMAIILVYLHGKIGQSLSNQMRMTKAMGINYSKKWWKEHNMENPPKIDPYEFIKAKLEWRYKKGIPATDIDTKIILGNSTEVLSRIVRHDSEKFSLLFTSPPYCSVTNYHSDQWLRYWMLGGAGNPLYLKEKYKDRFINKDDYYNLLNIVFGQCSKLMKKKSFVYVRTDIRQFTKETTVNILNKHFPDYRMYICPAKVSKKTQTEIMGNRSLEKGEIDIIMERH
jgi:DNA modification methylase